jgi:polyisoprenoid-binding protein YceI
MLHLSHDRQGEQMTVLMDHPNVQVPGRARRFTPVRVVALAAIGAVTAFAVAYAAFFTPDSPPALTLSGPGTSASVVGAPAGVWSVGAGSVAGYRVREKLLRLPASNDAVGRTGAVTGSFRLDTGREGVLVRSGMRIEADVSTLKSDEDRRDDHMRTMAIETDRFPTATFVSTSDLVMGPGATSALVRGELTLHGVTRTVEVPVQAGFDGGRIEVVGALSFPWALFDMERPNLSYVTVEADPTMEFQLFFDPTAT